jgi:hypothetical protein
VERDREGGSRRKPWSETERVVRACPFARAYSCTRVRCVHARLHVLRAIHTPLSSPNLLSESPCVLKVPSHPSHLGLPTARSDSVPVVLPVPVVLGRRRPQPTI